MIELLEVKTSFNEKIPEKLAVKIVFLLRFSSLSKNIRENRTLKQLVLFGCNIVSNKQLYVKIVGKMYI